MDSPIPAPIVDAVWRALRDGVGPVQPNRVVVFADRFRHDDFVPRYAVLDVVEDLGLDDLAHAEGFLEAFDVPTTTVYPRPRSRARLAMGTAHVALADVAELLVVLERYGLPVDPAPIVSAVKPRLQGKSVFTGAELRVWWFDQERHRSEAMMLSTGEKGVAGGVEIRTAAGYHAEAWLNAAGRAVQVWVRSPRYRRWRPT